MLADFQDFLRKPFSADMPATQWFFFIGFLIVCATLWGMVQRHLFME